MPRVRVEGKLRLCGEPIVNTVCLSSSRLAVRGTIMDAWRLPDALYLPSPGVSEDAPQTQQQQQAQQLGTAASTFPPLKSEAEPTAYGAARVADLRGAELARAELALSVAARMARGLRFVLAASPATWARVTAAYPRLAATLTVLHAVEPVVEDQHTRCVRLLLGTGSCLCKRRTSPRL